MKTTENCRSLMPRTFDLGHSIQRVNRSGSESLHGTVRHPRVWRTTSFVLALLGVIALIIWGVMPPDAWNALGAICFLGLAITVPLIIRALRDGAKRVITDHFLILIAAFSLYFLFGPLLLVIGPENQAAYALSWYAIDARSAVLVTAMNILG